LGEQGVPTCSYWNSTPTAAETCNTEVEPSCAVFKTIFTRNDAKKADKAASKAAEKEKSKNKDAEKAKTRKMYSYTKRLSTRRTSIKRLSLYCYLELSSRFS
jgi:hypothetical protein